MTLTGRQKVAVIVAFSSVVSCMPAKYTQAQELKFLTLRSGGGELTLVGDYESNVTGLQGSSDSEIVRRIATQRFLMAFNGSIIHSRFLQIGGNAGMVMSQGGIHGGGLDFPAKGEDLRYLLSLSLLPEHPVPIHFLGRRESTVVLAGQLQGFRVLQKQNSLRTNLGRGLPFSLGIGISESSRIPDKSGSFVAEERIQSNTDLTIDPFGILKSSQISIRRLVTDRPFYDSHLVTRIVNTRHVLGPRSDDASGGSRIELFANILDQTGTLNFSNELYSGRGRLALPLSLIFKVDWNTQKQRSKGVTATSSQLTSELNHQLYESLTTRINSLYSRQITSLIRTDHLSGGFDLRYRKRTGLGRLEAGLDIDETLEERNTQGRAGRIVQEDHYLIGFDLVFLNRNRVVIETIAVFDSMGISQFTEGEDFVVRTVGIRTGIERLATGRIGDGDRVLVDYEYDAGGSGTIDSGFTRWNLGLYWGNGSRIYLHRRTVTQDLRNGDLDVLLNPSETFLLGMTFRILGLILRGEYENNESRISPYLKRELSLGTRMQLDQWTEFGLTMRRVLLDNKESPFGIDLWGGRLSWNSIPVNRVHLQGSILYEIDRGSDLDRERTLVDIRAATRYGLTTLSLTLQYGEDRYGENNRTRSMGRLELVRRF